MNFPEKNSHPSQQRFNQKSADNRRDNDGAISNIFNYIGAER